MMGLMSEKRLVFILSALAVITPLAIDMYLPAISNMSRDIQADESLVSVSISLFFIGLALGQLIGGPISDAYGRKPMVSIGLGIFCVSSFVIVLIDNLYLLWIFRFIQAFGGGVATVNVSATVRDMFSGKESARIFAMIGSITILAPLISPILGLGIISVFGKWEVIFFILGVYSFLALYFYRKNIKISVSPNSIGGKPTPLKNYIEVLTNLKPMMLIAALVIASSGMYAILTFSSVIYEKYLGLSKFMFVVCFSMNITGIMIASRISMKLVRHTPPLTILKFGILAQTAISIIFFLVHNSANPFIVAPLLALFVGSLGFIFGNSLSLILDYYPKISGSANAIIGVLQYSVGALSGILVGIFSDTTLFSLSCIIMFSSILAATILFVGKRC